ncbi:MAG: class II D-tagatose-bisphosphate aldolase, non-catalytic subunit [Bacteroidales bacterium]|nr:class II D-tagatose-bisphosphate aldolase, non-catalytic subunit [Bacteroidales bacterium]
MDQELRRLAINSSTSVLELILARIRELKVESGIHRTIFAACPNSLAVIKAALKSAKRCNAPIKFATTLNQVDIDGGYTGLTQKEFVSTIRQEARIINFTGPVIIAIDHGGPWLKDIHTREKWSYQKTMDWIKKSFESAIDAGYDLIHVDPTVDITLPKESIIAVETVVDRTVELIAHTEKYRKQKNLPKIAYEVGTEEVHGGLAKLDVFTKFLELLKKGLAGKGLHDIWPCFVVGKVGTDLHTTEFDPEMARTLTAIAGKYGSVIKGHYSDNVNNPEDYPLSGMGAANIGPEFTEKEYDGLLELEELEASLFKEGRIGKISGIKKQLWDAVINSGRWIKWLSSDETGIDFQNLSPERQEWLVKTGCRYIWENPEVIAARGRLIKNMALNGLDGEEILATHIEQSMDKYFYKFNLVDLNKMLQVKEKSIA